MRIHHLMRNSRSGRTLELSVDVIARVLPGRSRPQNITWRKGYLISCFRRVDKKSLLPIRYCVWYCTCLRMALLYGVTCSELLFVFSSPLCVSPFPCFPSLLPGFAFFLFSVLLCSVPLLEYGRCGPRPSPMGHGRHGGRARAELLPVGA
jgi:hypothetical protein